MPPSESGARSRIVIVTAYYPPQASAGANRLRSFADHFAAAGWDCTVVAPTFGEACDDAASAASVIRAETGPPGRARGFLGRFLEEGRTALSLLRAARRTPADVYLVTSPFLGALLAAPLLLPASRLAFDVRDLTWEYRIDGGAGVRLAQRVLRGLAFWALRRARLVSASSPAEQAYLAKVAGPDRVVLVSNGVEAGFAAALAAIPRGAARGRVLYAGTVGRAQGAAILADVAALAPDLSITVAGEGAERALLERRRDAGLANLRVPARVSREGMAALYAQADVLFLRLRPGFASAAPSKLYEYAATGLPVVYMGAAADGCWRRLQGFEGVWRVEDEDAAGAAAALREAAASGLAPIAANQRRVREAFTREIQAGHLASAISDVFGAGGIEA